MVLRPSKKDGQTAQEDVAVCPESQIEGITSPLIIREIPQNVCQKKRKKNGRRPRRETAMPCAPPKEEEVRVGC